MKRTKIQNETVFMLEDEVYQGSVFPNNIKELKRDIKLFNNVDLQGSIFGNSIEFHSTDIYVRDSVFAMKGINLTGEKTDGRVWINSPVAAKESILADGVKNNRVRFTNNVSSDKINLKNSVVYGNVYGKDIILENSIVLGGVYCKNKLELNNSIIGTFDTKYLIQNGVFGLINNFASISNKPELNFDFYSIGLISFNGQSQDTIFKISKDEVFPFFENDENTKRYIISPTLRVFDIAKFEQILFENNQKLVYLTILDKNGDYKDHEEKFVAIEFPLFDIIHKEFKIESQLPKSDFINLPIELVNSELSNTNVSQISDSSNQIDENEIVVEKHEISSNEIIDQLIDEKLSEKEVPIETSLESDTEKETEVVDIESSIDELQSFCTNCGKEIKGLF